MSSKRVGLELVGLGLRFGRSCLSSVNVSASSRRGFCSLSRASTVKNVVYKDSPALELAWGDEKCHFPYIYLRDNCQCKECFEGSAKQRLVDTACTVNFNIQPSHINFDESSQSVGITWKDGHHSVFDATWLKERRFPETEEELLKNSQSFVPKRNYWDGHFSIPRSDFSSILTDDMARFNWLLNLSKYGLTLIENSSPEPEQLLKIPPKVGGFVRQTHYGSIAMPYSIPRPLQEKGFRFYFQSHLSPVAKEISLEDKTVWYATRIFFFVDHVSHPNRSVFEVKSKANPSNIAYSTRETPAHVDLAYYRYQPGTQFLHCIEQTQDEHGGGNYFVDGYYVAEKMRKEFPNEFESLTKVKLTFRDIGRDEYGEFEKKLERPIIGFDENGNYQNIGHNNFTRSSFINAKFEDVEKFYRAYYAWTKLINSDENKVKHKLKPGEIFAFDNIRILHGRTQFDPSISSRYLEGMYIDWDEVYSTLRVLRRKLGFVENDKNALD